jgi:hypothetical protein
VYGQVGNRLESANVNVLSSPFLRIGGHWLYKGSEVAQSMDIDVGQHVQTKGGEIHPFVRRVFDSPVVEIEPVYVNVGTDSPNLKKQSRLSAARALSPKIEGVYQKSKLARAGLQGY